MAAQTVPAVGTPQPALRFAALGPTERLCASLVCSRVVFWNARDAVTSGVPVGGREGGGGGHSGGRSRLSGSQSRGGHSWD